MAMFKSVRGIKAERAPRYDYVSVEYNAGIISVRAVDGYIRDSAHASLDMKAATKLVEALNAAIAIMEAEANIRAGKVE